MYIEIQTSTINPCFTDTRLIRTPHYYVEFALFLGTPLILTLSMAPSVTVLTGFDC